MPGVSETPGAGRGVGVGAAPRNTGTETANIAGTNGESQGVIPFLKVDKGLEAEHDGVSLMKPIPGLDALLGRALPPSGDTQSLVGAGLVACFLNLLGIVLLGRLFGAILRRRRRDLPRIVARDYGGTTAIVTIAAVLLAAGLINHSTVIAHQQAKRDAIVRAQGWIGDHAPAEFRSHMALVDTYAIEPGSIYRVCMPSSRGGARTYCVVVSTRMPFAQSVTGARVPRIRNLLRGAAGLMSTRPLSTGAPVSTPVRCSSATYLSPL